MMPLGAASLLAIVLLVLVSSSSATIHYSSVASTANPNYTAFSFPIQISSYATVFSAFTSTSPTQSLFLAVKDSSPVPIVSVGVLRSTGFTLMDANNEGIVVFIADLVDYPSSALLVADAFAAVNGQSKVVQIAGNQTKIPGKQLLFDRFEYASVDGALVVFWGEAKMETWAGIYVVSILEPEASLKIVVDYDTVIPVSDGSGSNEKFDYLSAPLLRNGVVAFFGSHKSNISYDHMVVYDRPVPGIFLHFLLEQKLMVVADSVMNVPDSKFENEKFTAFSDVSFDGETVAFIGQGSQGTLGVYAYNIISGVLERVVDNTCTVPGQDTLYFGSFPLPPSVGSAGIAVIGVDRNSNSGIYLYSRTISENNLAKYGNGFPIINQTLEFLDHTAIYLGMGISGFQGDSLAYYAVTNSYKSGIFTAELDLSSKIQKRD